MLLHHRRVRRDRPGAASWAGEARRRTRHAQHLPRIGVLLSRRDRRDARGATTSRAMPRTASSAASTSQNNVDGIERATRSDPRYLRRRAGADRWTSWRGCRSASRCAMRVARARKVIGVPIAAEEMAAGFHAAAACASRRQGEAFTVTPPSVPLRPRDRGGPDRGGGADPRLRAHSGAHPPRARGDDAAGARDDGARLHVLRERLAARGLSGGDQLQLRRAGMGGAISPATRRPDPAAQSDREPASR